MLGDGGFKNKAKIDSALIDSLMQFVGRAHFTIQGNTVTKDDSSAMWISMPLHRVFC